MKNWKSVYFHNPFREKSTFTKIMLGNLLTIRQQWDLELRWCLWLQKLLEWLRIVWKLPQHGRARDWVHQGFQLWEFLRHQRIEHIFVKRFYITEIYQTFSAATKRCNKLSLKWILHTLELSENWLNKFDTTDHYNHPCTYVR